MPRIVPRLEVEKEFTNRGCTRVKEYAFRSGTLWQTADGKLAFSIPQEIGGWTSEDDLRRVLEMLDGREQNTTPVIPGERWRGITIKAQTVRLEYTAKNGEGYILNLMDTPCYQ